jgi:tetratricopeptide (TPR) repeat protein
MDPPVQVDLSPGPARIGPYRLARRLGQGGMGEVFLAWDERLGRRVAVKRIRRSEPTARDRERLRREARAAARLSHPSVVQVYDLVEDATGDAIVLEYVEGRTLRELLADGLPPGSAVRLAREIAEGLAAAHAAGLVHRDLKAENVIVTRAGHAKILDFGIVKTRPAEAEESLTAHGAVLGTVHAMSPEQARGEEVDARSDLFSLGVLLYEMLTGRSPFRGGDPLETLRRIVTHHPPPVADLRPELPREISDLVSRLLAKRREDRPRGAAAVARELAALAAAPGLGEETWAPGALGEMPDEDPTEFVPAPAFAVPPGRRSEASSDLTRGRRTPLVGLAAVLVGLAAVLAVLAASAGYLLHRSPPGPLRVAVLAPRTDPGAGETLALTASGMLNAAFSTLASLEGLAPLDPAQAGAVPVSATQAARTVAADEVLALSLESEGPHTARVSLRRLDGIDGRVLWAGSFPVPADPRERNLRLLADAVAVHLRRAYPDRGLRPGMPRLEVTDRDYAELLRIKERIERGSVALEPELDRLEAVVRSSPRFLEGHLLMAEVAQSLFRSTREARHLERAVEAARAARELAPGDPRPLVIQFRTALAGNRLEEAQTALAAVAELAPGDPEVHALSGQLAQSRGDLEQAIAHLSAAVQSAPSWWHLYRLAEVEIRAGRSAEARRHLEELLARSPGHLWGLTKLGTLELQEGDPKRAEAIYLDLIRREPQRVLFTNLGLARSLLGRHAEAEEAYREALALDPGHVSVLLNLADTELALGRRDEARELYRRVLSRLDVSERAAGLSGTDRMIKAQCLAHLGRARDAVELTQQTLRESGDDPDILYAASLVYAWAGDRASALVNAELALDKGIQPRWFTLPAFGPLRQDPELLALLRRRPAPKGTTRG